MNRLVRARYENTQPRDYLDAWIRHLVLNALRPAGVEPRSVWHSRDGTFRLRPLADAGAARAELAALVALCARGLGEPLPFFAKASWSSARGKASEARGKWNGSPQRPGEAADPAHALAFRGVERPIDDEFEAVAQAVFAALLAHLDDPRVNSA